MLIKFPKTLIDIGPKHPKWQERVKIEILNLTQYVKFLQKKGGRSWFFLAPNKNPKYKFIKWDGYLQVPARPEIRFKMVILLPSNYPFACPRAFAEESIAEYAGKIFLKNIWEEDDGEKFVMICHEHMETVDEAWTPDLTIAHFFIREVYYWWAAQQNLIIDIWNKKNKGEGDVEEEENAEEEEDLEDLLKKLEET